MYSSTIDGETSCPILIATPPVISISIGNITNLDDTFQIYWTDERTIRKQQLNFTDMCKMARPEKYFTTQEGNFQKISKKD
jgi:hypothetical protein